MFPSTPPSTGNDILDEIHRAHASLSPEARTVMERAGIKLPQGPEAGLTLPHAPEAPPQGQTAPLSPAFGGAPQYPLPPIPAAPEVSSAQPPPFQGLSRGVIGNSPEPEKPIPIQAAPQGIVRRPIADFAPQIEQHQSEADRLRDPIAGKTGIQKLPGIARVPLQILDAVGSGLFPNITMGIPGTAAHHALLQHNADRAVEGDTASLDAAARRQLEGAQTENQEALPALHETQAELKGEQQRAKASNDQTKNELESEKIKNTAELGKAKNDSTLRLHGFKFDDQGKVVPLSHDEMSEEQQAISDLRTSQQELADANSALKKAQTDNVPKAAELAKQRIANANQTAATAAARLGLSMKEYEANYHGTEGGKPLPGSPADENGNPIGLKTAGVTKVPGAVQSRAAQGGVIKEAGDSLIKEIDAKKDTVGNLESYWKQAINGTPISDPAASGLMASLESFAALQPALHGFRSKDAMREFAKIIGGIPKNPEALKAAIKSIQNTAGIVQKQGTTKTVAPQENANSPSKEIWTRDANGKLVKQ